MTNRDRVMTALRGEAVDRVPLSSAPFKVLHVCGSGVLFDEFMDYALDPTTRDLYRVSKDVPS